MTRIRACFSAAVAALLTISFAFVSVRPAYSANRTTGVRKVAVILMRQPNTCDKKHGHPVCPKYGWPKGKANQDMGFGRFRKRHGSVADWFTKASGGQLRIAGKVFGYYNTPGELAYTDPITGGPNKKKTCDANVWYRNAVKMATKHKRDGFSVKKFDSVIVFAPRVKDQLGNYYCHMEGSATVGGNRIFLNGTKKLSTLIHELGHNMGLNHAGYFWCGHVDENCLNTYGDPNDAMGCFCPRYFNAEHKFILGWINEKNIQTIREGGGTYTLVSNENPKRKDRLPEIIYIPRDADSWYSVEFRHSSGYDRGSSVSGVWIHLSAYMRGTWGGAYPGANDTELFKRKPYKVGEIFQGGVNNVTIEVLRVTGSYATLRICVNGCSTPATTATIPPITDPPVTDPPITTPPLTDPPPTDPEPTDPPPTDPPPSDTVPNA